MAKICPVIIAWSLHTCSPVFSTLTFSDYSQCISGTMWPFMFAQIRHHTNILIANTTKTILFYYCISHCLYEIKQTTNTQVGLQLKRRLFDKSNTKYIPSASKQSVLMKLLWPSSSCSSCPWISFTFAFQILITES